jgi:hypothetical protein
MANRDRDPPGTLAEAEIRFSRFLFENNLPSKIRWIAAGQIALTTGPRILVQCQGAEIGREEAKRRYVIGLERGLGICMRAICATDTETIASVYVPSNLQDAQDRLMAQCLKLNCPVERLPTTVVSDPAEWESLGFETQLRSEIMCENFEL